jgi:hypothetical protein
MKIISHRGLWRSENEKNLNVAFENSFELGFGTETDLRDYMGEIVISHDIANSKSISLIELLTIYNKYDKKNLPLALNIKADGLQHKLKSALHGFEVENYFVFDMSLPDTINYINEEIHFFSRQSEYELKPAFYKECNGIWLDAFNDDWYSMDLIEEHIKNGKYVAIVSPDLHKRSVIYLWKKLKSHKIHEIPGVILCTDILEEAIIFFK